MADVTIFEQDGKVYAALSHTMNARELAKETAAEIRYMDKIPRSCMRVITSEELKQKTWAKPSKI